MAVSMITSYADSSGGGSSRLLDFGVPSSGDSGASAPPMNASASAMQAPTDSFQSSGSAAYSPPPQAMPSSSGSFDFVA